MRAGYRCDVVETQEVAPFMLSSFYPSAPERSDCRLSLRESGAWFTLFRGSESSAWFTLLSRSERRPRRPVNGFPGGRGRVMNRTPYLHRFTPGGRPMFEKFLFRSAAACAAMMLLIGTAGAATIAGVPGGKPGHG